MHISARGPTFAVDPVADGTTGGPRSFSVLAGGGTRPSSLGCPCPRAAVSPQRSGWRLAAATDSPKERRARTFFWRKSRSWLRYGERPAPIEAHVSRGGLVLEARTGDAAASAGSRATSRRRLVAGEVAVLSGIG